MAEIKAFRGLRYTEKAGEISELCCPPYDIISDKQREEYIRKNENNVIRLELPDSYEAAGRLVNDWIETGILAKDEKPGIYIYEMAFASGGRDYAVKGIIAQVKLEEFSKGVILPHEETLSKAKTDRFNLMTAAECNFSQIYSLYMDEDNSVFSIIDGASKGNPDAEFIDDDNVTHRLWLVYDEKIISEICTRFLDKKLYIADGHHRYETALNYRHSVKERKDKGTSEYVPMMLVNMENSGLVVLPTHRIVRGLADFNSRKILENCAEYFDITEKITADVYPEIMKENYRNNKKSFVMYADGKYSVLTLKDSGVMERLMPECSAALKNLDVSVLHKLVLERVFGIDKANMAAQINLTYTRLESEAIDAVDQNKANCAFLLNPTRVSEIRDVAMAGEKMPQKSTYFYPKLITGLVMNKIYD